MADFLLDNFNGTEALTGHVPDTGSAWALRNGGPSLSQIAGGVVKNTSTFEVDSNGTTPPSPDYEVEFTWKQLISGFSDGQMYVVIRGTGSNDTDANWYFFENRGSQFRINRRALAVYTQIGTEWNNTPAVDQVLTGKISVSGSALELYVDGVLRCSGTDANITGAGQVYLLLANGRVEIQSLHAAGIAIPTLYVTRNPMRIGV